VAAAATWRMLPTIRLCRAHRRRRRCPCHRTFALPLHNCPGRPPPKLLSRTYEYAPWSVMLSSVFTARCYASAVLAMGLCLSLRLCLSVSMSVTSRRSTKTAKHRITQTIPYDSPGTLVFCCQRSPRNSIGVTPYEGAEYRWGGSKSATLD